MTIDKAFEQWLLDNKIYNQYLGALKKELVYETIEEMQDGASAETWIDEAFYWEETSQGFRFWEHYNHEWREYVKNY